VRGSAARRCAIGDTGKTTDDSQNSCVLYARVATLSQLEQLRRQTADLMAEYPGTRAIAEIGSGLNFRRRRFLAMLERVISGDIKCIVVAHQDRLVRFGVDFVEWLCRQFGWQIVVLDRQYRGWEAELIADLKTIFGRFSGRLRGLGKYDRLLRQEFPAAEEINAIASGKTEGGAVGRAPTTGYQESP